MQDQAVLSKWGNGQGIRISKAICRQLGIAVGDVAVLDVTDDNTLNVCFDVPRYSRRRVARITEFMPKGGAIVPSAEPFGEDVGAEVVL
ncbi:MAG: hypothetical protein LBR39_00700 [Coriobacteriales bacterium]|nr:hypothetical protein [Coriobacteriales bacterium]